MASRGCKQWAVMATKTKWSKPRFVHHGEYRHLLIFDGRKEAHQEAERINRLGDGFLYPRGGKPIPDVTYKAFPVWTETML